MPFSQASWLMIADCNLTPFEPSYHRLRSAPMFSSGSVVMKDGVISATAPVRLESTKASFARFEAPSYFDKHRQWCLSAWRVLFEAHLVGTFLPETCDVVPLRECEPLVVWDEFMHNAKCRASRIRCAPSQSWGDDLIAPRLKRSAPIDDGRSHGCVGVVRPVEPLMIMDIFPEDGGEPWDPWEHPPTSPCHSSEGSHDEGGSEVASSHHSDPTGVALSHCSGAHPGAPLGETGSRRRGLPEIIVKIPFDPDGISGLPPMDASICYYNTGAYPLFVAFCAHDAHNVDVKKVDDQCHRERAAIARPRRPGSGRPLGLLMAWLFKAHSIASRSDHVKLKIIAADRVAARAFLRTVPGSEALFEKERPKNTDTGEESEPERIA